MSMVMHPLAAPEILRLRDRVSYLEADNLQLKRMLGVAREHVFYARCRDKFGLTKHQARILGCLMAASVRTTDSLMRAYGGDDELPSTNTIKVQIYNLRARLRPHQITINVQYGVGYSINAETRERLHYLLGAAAQ